MWEPFGAVSSNTTYYWKDGPSERGTFSILTTCFITLALSTYPSLHLNIPLEGRENWYHTCWRKFCWVLVGIFAPDYVAVNAFQDWFSAKALEQQVRTLLKETYDMEPNFQENRQELDSEYCRKRGTTNDISSNASLSNFNWTRVHSHFALMGGFVFNLKTMGIMARSPYIGGDSMKQVFITAPGIRKIAEFEPALLTKISKEMIEDKSKANGFAKFIVCVQAIWFLIQTVGRLASRLPISLLELNTAIHAICCLANYVAWWHKPMDIERPYSIDLSDASAQKLCAWMVMSTKMGARRENLAPKSSYRDLILEIEDIGQHHGLELEKRSVQALEQGKSREVAPSRGVAGTRRLDIEEEYEAKMEQNDQHYSWKLNIGETLFGFRLQHNNASACSKGGWTVLSLFDVRFLKLAHTFRLENRLDVPWQDVLAHCTDSGALYDNSETAKTNQHRSFYACIQEYFLLIGTMLGAGMYGGLHLLAWNSPFDSGDLKAIWHLAAIMTASPLLIVIVSYSVTRTVKFTYRISLKRWRKPKKSDEGVNTLALAALFLLVSFIGSMIFPLYQFARIWLVVGCFLNLSNLPDEVYKETDWSQIIPHFGAG